LREFHAIVAQGFVAGVPGACSSALSGWMELPTFPPSNLPLSQKRISFDAMMLLRTDAMIGAPPHDKPCDLSGAKPCAGLYYKWLFLGWGEGDTRLQTFTNGSKRLIYGLAGRRGLFFSAEKRFLHPKC
jgi:hypothetical protein